ALYAGTTDTLGLSTTWNKVEGFLSDPYLTKIVASLMVIFGIMVAIKKDFLYGAIIIVMAFAMLNIGTIAGKFASAIF
ncbi:MAG: hypothetical protein IE909_18575, partial [Campylobacterales bacterium]|nr:hypothetical protein [Campylobacterales bacterium]